MFQKPPSSNIQVKIISTGTIKPTSPTPNHLKTFKLSLLDQLSPLTYSPFVFFYAPSDIPPRSTEDKLTSLKDSLSKALTRFYPLAGRIKDRLSIDCNDEGVSYIEAQVSCDMFEFLKDPKLELLDLFLPCEPIWKGPPELAIQVAVKASVFACGGIAVGVCFLHKIIDAATFSPFLKEWAAIARGDNNAVYAHNKAALLFPSNEQVFNCDFSWLESFMAEGRKSCFKRFVFDAQTIRTLKDKARSESVPNPTSYEVICGLIWKSAMNASTTISGLQNPSVALNAVNIRTRMKLPMPDYAVGNLIWTTAACYSPISKTDMELQNLVSLLRKSIEKVTGDFIQKLQGEDGYVGFCNALEEVKEMYSGLNKPITYINSGLGKNGFYKVDFGWGNPVWVGVGGASHKLYSNAFMLVEGRTGDDIEAWLILDEVEMAIVERDPDFLAYATLNPSIQF